MIIMPISRAGNNTIFPGRLYLDMPYQSVYGFNSNTSEKVKKYCQHINLQDAGDAQGV
jgi:hypothetical protein